MNKSFSDNQPQRHSLLRTSRFTTTCTLLKIIASFNTIVILIVLMNANVIFKDVAQIPPILKQTGVCFKSGLETVKVIYLLHNLCTHVFV